MTYRFLPHTADIKVAIEGHDLESLLHDGVTISRQLFVGRSPVEPQKERPLRIEASSAEELFLRFLKDLLYLFESEGFIPFAVDISQLHHTSLVGTVSGQQFDGTRHLPQPEVKAVTRHGFMVVETERGWRAEVVFDV